MYIEFLLLTFDYFKTLNKKKIVYEWFLPLFFATISAILFSKLDFEVYSKFKDSSLDILGVLLGFSIAIITILVTGSGKNLEEIKNTSTEIVINSKKISLYELILINFSYSVIMEILLIVGCLVLPIINKICEFSSNIKIVLYSIMVFIVLHILLLTLRNITDFYLIITKK